MEPSILKILGQFAGLAGLGLGVAFLLFRQVLRMNIFAGLNKGETYRMIRLVINYAFALALAGMLVWLYANTREVRSTPPPVDTPPTTTPTATTTAATPPPSPTPLKTISLPAQLSVNGYQKTDICVDKGTKLKITAQGTIFFGQRIRGANPDGKTTFTAYGLELPIDGNYYKVEGISFGALLCKLDTESEWQKCGRLKQYAAAAAGCVEFEVNDKIQDDNHGDYSVKIDLVR